MKGKIKRTKVSFWLAMASSLFLFISGTNGFSNWVKIRDVVLSYVDYPLVGYLFVPILIIASLGALSVFIGGILALKRKRLPARILILLGSGVGLIGFIFNLLVSNTIPNLSLNLYLSFSSLGVVLAILAQIFLNKKKRKRKKSLFKKLLHLK
ncbi:MAG: hypothetical protein PF487_08750 [Bacteroidales bacterium]|jgi:hypothetical protein|nr:hypothetical protein [Bacteroidales bacterium]